MTGGVPQSTIGAAALHGQFMADTSKSPRSTLRSRSPQGSVVFEKIVPILLASLGIVMLVLILFAFGVLLGLIRF